jgi:hypothetical protein
LQKQAEIANAFTRTGAERRCGVPAKLGGPANVATVTLGVDRNERTERRGVLFGADGPTTARCRCTVDGVTSPEATAS